MHAATDRLEFAPPPAPGQLRAIGLAVLAHAFLLAALTWGVHWKREAVTVTAEAELWSELPQTAAPRLVKPPAEPPPPPPAPPRAPPPVVAPPQPIAPLVDIALEREKLRLKKKQELDRQKELEQQRREKLKQEKLLLDKRRLLDKREQDKKALEDKKKSEQEAKRKDALKEQQETKKLEAQRQANLQRMAGLAGASGTAGATGTAQQSSGPSAGYAGRIRARIKPNIVFTEAMAGNPMADVEVRTAPDGTIISRKLLKSSGVKAWDDAVLKAIDKTEVLPRDVDGRVPPVLEISFRPKD